MQSSPAGRGWPKGPGEGETARSRGAIRGNGAARRSLPPGVYKGGGFARVRQTFGRFVSIGQTLVERPPYADQSRRQRRLDLTGLTSISSKGRNVYALFASHNVMPIGEQVHVVRQRVPDSGPDTETRESLADAQGSWGVCWIAQVDFHIRLVEGESAVGHRRGPELPAEFADQTLQILDFGF